jgi:quinoprotein glucose dehydrogenase
MKYRILLASAVVSLAVTAVLSAQQAAAPERSIWDGVYTNQQAEFGAFLYATHCEACHKPDMSGRGDPNGDAAPLAGDAFWREHKDDPLSRIFGIMKMNMPANAPGTLKDSDYAALLAMILQANQYPAGNVELPADATELAKLRFEDRPAAPGN